MAISIMIHREKWIFSFLLLLYLFRLIIINYLGLAPDEAYYWYWSKYLDWSYLDHPPMVAYLMAFFTGLGGDSEFFVRVGGLLCSVIALLFLYLTARKLVPNNNQLSWELLFVINITPLFSVGCIVQTPDTPMILFWTVAVFCGAQIISGASGKWWYLWGVALGLGLLSKYPMILIVPCQFAFLLFSRSHRHWLLRKEPYLALLLGLVIFSPVLLWNWQHQWVSFAFQLHHGFSPVKRAMASKLLEYIAGQAGIMTPLLFLAFIYYSVKGFYLSIQRGISAYLYLALLSWPILVFFGFSSMLGKVAGGNWPAPAYITGLILMWSVYREYFGEKRWHKNFIYIAIGLAVVMSLLLHIHLLKPIIPLSPKLDTTRQFHGWRELGNKINSYIKEYPHQEGYFLMANGGQRVSEAVFYSGNRYMGFDFFRPERYIFLPDIDQLQGKNAIILLHRFRESTLKKYEPYFTELTMIGKHTFIYRGEKIKELRIILGKGYRGNWLPFNER